MKKRTFTPEFKKEAVALVNEQGHTIAKAAAFLGLSEAHVVKYRFIHEHAGKFGVRRLCRVMRVSPSVWYA